MLSPFLDRWASSTIPMRTLLKHGPQRYLLASRSTSCLAQIVNSAGCWRRSTETVTRPKKQTTLRTSPQRAAIRIYTTATVPSRTMVSPCSHRSRPSVSRRACRRRLPPTGGAARRRALTRTLFAWTRRKLQPDPARRRGQLLKRCTGVLVIKYDTIVAGVPPRGASALELSGEMWAFATSVQGTGSANEASASCGPTQ